MSKPKPFPAITGSCVCSNIRYRLLTSPLFCYACHCPDCQKSTGSAFGLFLSIETYNVAIISPTHPVVVVRENKPGILDRHVECPKCKTAFWNNNVMGPAVCDLRVGTLDFPSLMEPDLHIYTESMLDWVRLPEGAKRKVKTYKREECWPKSSLKRLEVCMKRLEEAVKKREADEKARKERQALSGEGGAGGDVEPEETSAEGEKTPTAGEWAHEAEDDEAFEKRYKETERALQARLEKLSLKLEEEEVTRKMEGTKIGL